MFINERGLSLIKSFESLQLKSYVCPAGKWTLGYGHTGTDVKPNQTITTAEAEELLLKDIENFNIHIQHLITAQLNENQFSALVSFTFNVGIDNLKSSTLLKKVNSNPSNPTIKNEFLKWVYANKSILNGLVKRRTAESDLYISV